MAVVRSRWRAVACVMALVGACRSSDSSFSGASPTAGTAAALPTQGHACASEVEVFATALADAVQSERSALEAMKADLADACGRLGLVVTWRVDDESDLSDEELRWQCSDTGMLGDEVRAHGLSPVVYQGGCGVDAAAQLACDQACAGDTPCDPGTVQSRCLPGHLNALCTGDCEGARLCGSDDGLAIPCEGECAGTCNGACDGACAGSCDGECTFPAPAPGVCACDGTCSGPCAGTCSGECTGTCETAPAVEPACGDQARCVGECTGAVADAVCDTPLTPAPCVMELGCGAACMALGAFGASCTLPHVTLLASDGSTSSLGKPFAIVLDVATRVELGGSVAEALAQSAQDLRLQAQGCVLTDGADSATWVAQTQEAVTSLDVMAELVDRIIRVVGSSSP